jgi:hypothetical protein
MSSSSSDSIIADDQQVTNVPSTSATVILHSNSANILNIPEENTTDGTIECLLGSDQGSDNRNNS